MIARGGLGPAIFPLFEKKCGCRIRAIAAGDTGQTLTRLQLDAERGKPGAQLVLGLDTPGYERARRWLLESGVSGAGGKDLVPEVREEIGKAGGFVPYDYGYFAFVSDQQALQAARLIVPKSLRDL